MLFGYIFKCLHVSRAGKALAGWKPTQDVEVPTLEVLPDEAHTQINKITKALFLWAPKPLQDKGRLAPLRDVLMATLLKDLRSMESTKKDTDFFCVFYKAAHRHAISSV